jgi:hypothetical protein
VSGGIRWGFACKVLNGSSPLTTSDRLDEGINQIENSPADTGFVFFNFKNLIDHRRAWPLTNEETHLRGAEEPRFGSWRDTGAVLRQLEQFMNPRSGACIEYNGADILRALQGRADRDGILAWSLFGADSTSVRASRSAAGAVVGRLKEFRRVGTQQPIQSTYRGRTEACRDHRRGRQPPRE